MADVVFWTTELYIIKNNLAIMKEDWKGLGEKYQLLDNPSFVRKYPQIGEVVRSLEEMRARSDCLTKQQQEHLQSIESFLEGLAAGNSDCEREYRTSCRLLDDNKSLSSRVPKVSLLSRLYLIISST